MTKGTKPVTTRNMLPHLPAGHYIVFHNNVKLGFIETSGMTSDTHQATINQITEWLRAVSCDKRGTLTFQLIHKH